MMSSQVKFILASGSKYRAERLATLQIPFQSIKPNIDETPRPKETPEHLVERLSVEKAQSALTQIGSKSDSAKTANSKLFVIGSDQVAVLGNEIIGKPGNQAAAEAQLTKVSGQSLRFLTGLCLICHSSGQVERYTEVTHVTFKTLNMAQIRRYLALEKPFDCAGSFKSERLGISILNEIKGRDPNALIGLPLIGLVDLASRFNIEIP